MLKSRVQPKLSPTTNYCRLFHLLPRPIALVSTIDKDGRINLSPFSFFNVFSVNPPILVFSPVKSGRFGTNKHTLENILEVKECVIGLVTEETAQQVLGSDGLEVDLLIERVQRRRVQILCKILQTLLKVAIALEEVLLGSTLSIIG